MFRVLEFSRKAYFPGFENLPAPAILMASNDSQAPVYALLLILCMLRIRHQWREPTMTRLISSTVLCLIVIASVNAEELTMNARELAETRLLAEWVGVPEKQFILGNVYFNGEGVPQDYAEASRWYRLAADQGLAESQHMLGVMYDRGDGMPQDFSIALKWFREAADQGFAPAQYDLGSQYATGEGVPQNFSEAYVWFSLAASAGLEMARRDRDTFAGKLSNEEITQAQKRATQLFEKIQQGKTEE
jgi:hypothetical protein